MTEDERKAEREQGLEQGYLYAAERWKAEGKDDKDAARESIACLVYRQPSQILRQHIEEHEGFGLEAEYLSGFAAGMRKALDETDAAEWLSTLPGYS